MTTSAQKGQQYKSKTKKWLESKGYQVCFLERIFMLFIKGRMIPIKKDQFASDLLAVSSTEIIFVQVKFLSGKQKDNGIPAAEKEFAKFVFPHFAQKWIVMWTPRVKEPMIKQL